MPDKKTTALFGRFFEQARTYLAQPGVMAGLALDELTVRARQSALTDLRDPDMGRRLESLLKAIRHQDLAQAQKLIDEVASRAGPHGIDPG